MPHRKTSSGTQSSGVLTHDRGTSANSSSSSTGTRTSESKSSSQSQASTSTAVTTITFGDDHVLEDATGGQTATYTYANKNSIARNLQDQVLRGVGAWSWEVQD